MANEYAVTTNEIMDFLKENMVTKQEFEERFEKLEIRVDRMDGRLDAMDSRLMRVESQMVTKEYLDDKLADLKGDILTIFRKEDRRVTALVEIMQRKNLLNDEEARFLGTLRPLVPISE